MKKISLYITLIFTIVFTSCEDLSTDVNVNYAENPTSDELANYNLANTFIQSWYNNTNSYNGPGLAIAGMADAGTCSWGNSGMRDTSSEPRVAWNNETTYGSGYITTTYFNSLYNSINDINALMAKIAFAGDDPDDAFPRRTESLTRFAQAANFGYIALLFDQVWLKDESGPINDGESVTPQVALELCLEKLDQAIAIADNNSFEITTDFINGVTLTSTQWSQYLNSFAARLMVNMPRNASQKAAVDWSRVLAYTNKGLTYDYNITSDGWTTWYTEWVYYQIYPGWGRTDMRVINMLDPNTPDYFTEASGVYPESSSDDSRLASDFQYLTSQDFIPSRGIYHFSTYRHSRFDAQAHGSNWTGATPEMLKAENDLYKAEAQYRTGDLAGAAATINASSRSLRGNLPAIGATASEIEEAIHYERIVELMNSGLGLAFFEMRGKDLLQAGTPLHFPVPGDVLLAGGFEIYTFGGTTGVAGEDYSTGGWR
ncbi:hypothetical protein [Polaribacter sp. Asnod6-C07]|uniref:hypothetical protein n=1 Tax=Polaribacter sp. Asnod6-C07 TaxID=3160582 RepID=UPI003865966A